MIIPLKYALNCGWTPLLITGAIYQARGGPDGLNFVAMIVCSCLWFLLLHHSFESSNNGPDPNLPLALQCLPPSTPRLSAICPPLLLALCSTHLE